MGHLAIVTQKTRADINNEHPYISYKGTLRADIYKTIADLFADALTVRDGDKIFTWCVNGDGANGDGFDRYYIANGNVFFMPTEEFPIKIGVREEVKYNTSISEANALDLFLPKLLWNAIGKKSLGRGRSLSHQTIDEDEILIGLLNKANEGASPIRTALPPIHIIHSKEIKITNFSFTETNPPIMGTKVDDGDGKFHIPLNSVPIENIIWNAGNKFLCEKALEAYVCRHIDKEEMNFCKLIGHPKYSVLWIGNYLPFGVQGGSIDMVVEIGKGNKRIIVLLELKDDIFGYGSYKKDVDNQILPYLNFIKQVYKHNRGGSIIVESVFLSHSPVRLPNPERNPIYKGVKWIGYDIDKTSKKVLFKTIY